MKYGLIGEKLGHSFSKEVHGLIADYDYELVELTKEELAGFMKNKDFKAINVTIPYKESVIPYLYHIDEAARLIGAVNTIVNRNGRLYGYNTDFYGMSVLIKKCGICIEGEKVVILGSGGTSKTANAVVKHLGAGEIIRVSRTAREDAIDYSELYASHTDATVIINTTPVGMYPKSDARPVDIEKFKNLKGYIDAIYNPLRTECVLDCKARNIKADGGLYMLVAQAVLAARHFMDKDIPDYMLDLVFDKMMASKENVVLIGMPSCGKSTVGKVIAERLGRKFVDTDQTIADSERMAIPDIFSTRGEPYFRECEADAVKRVSEESELVIATGGGVPLRQDNLRELRKRGKLFFIDRSPELLISTKDRPLSKDRDAIMRMYEKRHSIYERECDDKICGDGSVTDVADLILEKFK